MKLEYVFYLQNQHMHTQYAQQCSFYLSYMFWRVRRCHQGENTQSYVKHVKI
jgi:hypothetical protein